MNMFTNPLGYNTPAARPILARTENGMRARASTSKATVDLFGSIAAMRGKNPVAAFQAAAQENLDTALRIAQWARDVRGGAGERKIYRDILLYLEKTDPGLLVESKLLDNLPELGRFDDLLIFTDGAVNAKALGIFATQLRVGNGLAAKWAPRKGQRAFELRATLDMTPRQYRKFIVGNTNVVETQMCAKEFGAINFSHVPSVAMSRYMTAFHRNAPEAFQAYKDALKRNDGTAKVNATAVYPYDVIKMLRANRYSYFGNRQPADNTVANAMWEALPDYMNDQNVLSMVDVSGSMSCPVGGSTQVTCMDVALSLGLYVSDKSKGAFKDVFLTFSGQPQLLKLTGSLSEKMNQMETSEWAMNTNLNAAFAKVLSHAITYRVPATDMPKIVLILSDMQFDACARFDDSAMQMIRRKYEDAGYETPAIVFWNLREAGNKPVKFNDNGVALVSGFSPSIMKSILAADLDKFSPEAIMLQTVGIDRYSW